MNQPDLTGTEFEIDTRGGPRAREEAQQEESKKASKASQLIQGEGKLSPWKFPRKKD
jgi:hypothetical protein